jgi:uracil-DNA glycosylase family 4
MALNSGGNADKCTDPIRGFVDVVPPQLPATVLRQANGKRKKRDIAEGERGCDACPLKETWTQLSTPQMPVSGSGDILVLGEGPGEDEDRQGRPFVGVAGKLLRKVLPSRQTDRLAMTNIVRCRPPNNRTPTARETHCCSMHLEADIAAGNYKAILGLGGAPLAHFLTETTITQVQGLKFPVEIGGKLLWYFPTLHPSFVNRTGGERSPMLPILSNDLKTFFKNVDRWPEPVIDKPQPSDVICAYSEEEARGWCDKLRQEGKPIGFDIETTGLRPNEIDAAILTAAVSNGKITVAWPVRHGRQPTDWGLPLLFDVTRSLRWIAHHAGFELAWLHEHARRSGIAWEPEKGFDDSMAAARLFQRRETCLNLGILTRLYTGTNIKKLSAVNRDRLALEPLEDVLPYNGLDAWGSWRIMQQLGPHVSERSYQSILDTIESVTEMQLLGLDVDQEAAKRLHDEWGGRATAASVHAQTIYEVRQYVRDTGTEFNIGSPEQVGEALVKYGRVPLPKNSDGTYKTDDATLTQAAPDNPLARDTLEHRHAKKLDSTYVQPLLQVPARFADKRIHPVYSTMLTRTFRLSAEDPNCQNFPKRKDRELRTPIVPPRGCVWASADYGQLEARVYGMASKDNALCDSIIGNEDIHSYWLDHVLNAYPPYLERLRHKVTPNDTDQQVRKGGRDIIKSDLVFASFFGTTAKNVADRTGIPLEIATEVLGQFWRRYDSANRWLKARRREYFDSGTTRNLCGVERYGIMTGNEPINTPIQSTAARLVLEAQNELYQLSKKQRDPYLMPRINIHDDLVLALPDDDSVMDYIKEISRIMTKVRFGFQIVPLKVEWKIGYSWAELYDVFEYTGDYVR